MALAVHAGIYLSGKPATISGAEFGMEEPPATVEVALVESSPPEAVEPAPAPEPSQPEPIPEPPKPEPELPKPKEEIIPLPPEPKAEPKPGPQPLPKPVEKKQKPTAQSAATSTQRTTGTPGATTGVKGGATSGPGLLHNPKPAYPAESRAAKERGTVLLSVAVEASGRPGNVRVLKSSGFPRLDRAAQEAVRRWRFKPAMRNGVPCKGSVDVPVRFELPR